MTTINNFNSAVSGKTATPITPSTHTSSGKYSVGIVCSESNGKRVTFTAALASHLKLGNVVYITAYAEDGFIVIGATPYNNLSSSYKLSGKDKKIAYASDLVHYLIDNFHLDYSTCVSRSFGNIIFNNDPNTPMAILRFPTTIHPVKHDIEAEYETNIDSES